MRFHDLVDAACLAGRRPAESELDALRATYRAGVAGVDAHVDALLGALRSRGVLADTLVVLAADHGEELFDHGNYPYHGAAIHGSTLRVPLVLSWPRGLAAGERVAAAVDLTDVAPTVLELFDLAAPGPMEGSSLLGLVGGGTRERDLLAELVALDLGALPPELTGELHAIRRGRWRLIHNPDGVVVHKPPFEGTGLLHPTALHDLERDPGELVDVAAAHPDVVRELAAALESELTRLRARAARAQPPSPELVETLRSLGYVGDPR
jgi:arylsulfatase A-like enzyme